MFKLTQIHVYITVCQKYLLYPQYWWAFNVYITAYQKWIVSCRWFQKLKSMRHMESLLKRKLTSFSEFLLDNSHSLFFSFYTILTDIKATLQSNKNKWWIPITYWHTLKMSSPQQTFTIDRSAATTHRNCSLLTVFTSVDHIYSSINGQNVHLRLAECAEGNVSSCHGGSP